jgi:hypothetical protein
MNTPVDNDGWVAYLADSPEDYFRMIRLYLFRSTPGGRTEVLKPDGTIISLGEGTKASEDSAFVLPVQAVNALAEGIDRYRGNTSHTATEIRVLREALEIERARVDRYLPGWGA